MKSSAIKNLAISSGLALLPTIPVIHAQSLRGPADQSAGVQEAWVRTVAIGDSTSSADQAIDLEIDVQGNVYITGTSTRPISGADYFTAKYDANGRLVWSAYYDGPGRYHDYAGDLSLDRAGNVYVTGISENQAARRGLATVKYNNAGVQQWEVHFGNSQYLAARAIMADEYGNVYAAGITSGNRRNCGSEVILMKYGNDGKEQWVNRAICSEGSNIQRGSLVFDTAGNVYLTCSRFWSDYIGGGDIYVDETVYTTVKYEKSGDVVWAASYDDPDDSDGLRTFLALDDQGNSCVTGSSGITIKYDRDGIAQWVAHDSSEFTAIAVDLWGNVLVSGIVWRRLGNAVVVAKYDRTGNLVWRAVDDSWRGEYHAVKVMKVDDAGNVHVTGWSSETYSGSAFTTVKFDSSGRRVWTTRYQVGENSGHEPANLAVDSLGNVFVTGTSASDFATIKYDAQGTEQWVVRHNGEGTSHDRAHGLAVDLHGNVYVTGTSRGYGTSDDFLSIKYDAQGEQQWLARYNGPANLSDRPVDLVVDYFGNLYLTGESRGDSTNTDIVTVKINATGQQQWADRYNDDSDSTDIPVAMKLDNAGNVIVIGSSFNLGGSQNVTTIKYASAGAREWIARYDHAAGADVPAGMVVDSAGSTYIALTSHKAEKAAIVAIKYDQLGRLEWAITDSSFHSGNHFAKALALDQTGNIYLTGHRRISPYNSAFVTSKYNPRGERQWTATFDGAANGYDEPVALAPDVLGNVYVGGNSHRSESSDDFVVVKYDSSGTELWVAYYHGFQVYIDRLAALAVDKFGNAYVTGWSGGINTGLDFATVKYDREGVEEWVARFTAPNHGSNDLPVALAVDESGNVYVTGTSSSVGSSAFTTIKYTQNAVSVKTYDSGGFAPFALRQNHPNPFNPSTAIRYNLSRAGHTTLKIYNLAGKEVATLVNEIKQAGEYEAQWNAGNLATGVYLYRLQVEDMAASGRQVFTATKKLLLIK